MERMSRRASVRAALSVVVLGRRPVGWPCSRSRPKHRQRHHLARTIVEVAADPAQVALTERRRRARPRSDPAAQLFVLVEQRLDSSVTCVLQRACWRTIVSLPGGRCRTAAGRRATTPPATTSHDRIWAPGHLLVDLGRQLVELGHGDDPAPLPRSRTGRYISSRWSKPRARSLDVLRRPRACSCRP